MGTEGRECRQDVFGDIVVFGEAAEVLEVETAVVGDEFADDAVGNMELAESYRVHARFEGTNSRVPLACFTGTEVT